MYIFPGMKSSVMIMAVFLFFFSIAEVPDVHLILSERTDVIKQCFLAANSAMFSTDVPMNVLLMLLCIFKISSNTSKYAKASFSK